MAASVISARSALHLYRGRGCLLGYPIGIAPPALAGACRLAIDFRAGSAYMPHLLHAMLVGRWCVALCICVETLPRAAPHGERSCTACFDAKGLCGLALLWCQL